MKQFLLFSFVRVEAASQGNPGLLHFACNDTSTSSL